MAWKNKAKQDEYWNKVKDKYNSEFKKKYDADSVFRESVLKLRREWREKNKDKVRLYQQKQSKRKLAYRFYILSRDKFTCQYCGRKAPDVVLEIDHVQPKSKGGKDTEDNYKTSCLDCNRGKTNTVIN